MMIKVYIFGVGKGKETVKGCIRKEVVTVVGYLDNAAERYPEGIDGLPIFKPEKAAADYDYIIISVMKYADIEKQLLKIGVPSEKIIRFFKIEDAVNKDFWSVLDRHIWRLEVLCYCYMRETYYLQHNLKYEIADAVRKEELVLPVILPAEEAIKKICSEDASLIRFGDGEFSLMHMKKRAKFQKVNRELALRLREILNVRQDGLLIAIADNYGSLEKYTHNAANDIREYLTEEVRQEHMELLDLEREYYDAYLSRPYIQYKDKTGAKKRFDNLKQIWNRREIVIIEGDKTRLGIGNDLFKNADMVSRILAPAENAFERYEEIKKTAERCEKSKLILISLGPTAKVLAYDLFMEGYQVIDVGHIDLEYEWYLRGVSEKCDIPYKYVQELNCGEIVIDNALPKWERRRYEEQIVARIG